MWDFTFFLFFTFRSGADEKQKVGSFQDFKFIQTRKEGGGFRVVETEFPLPTLFHHSIPAVSHLLPLCFQQYFSHFFLLHLLLPLSFHNINIIYTQFYN